MNFLPSTWANVAISTEHTVIYAAVIGFAFLFTYLHTTGTYLQRLLCSAAIGAATAALGPMLVSPAYLSSGPWIWGLALVGAVSFVSAALMRAVRAALGCVLSSRAEWILWVVGFIGLWTAMPLVGAMRWTAAFLVASVLVAAFSILLPAYISSVPVWSEHVKAGFTLAAPIAITGFPWAVLVPVLVAFVLAALGFSSTSAERQQSYGRISVVSTHAIAGLLPLTLLAFGATALPAA